MNRPFPFFVALRYIFAGKGNRYLSFVSLSSLIGMILGVLSLLVVLAVMNGFRSDLENRVLRLIPHAHINADTVIPDWPSLSAKISGFDGVRSVSPMIERNILLMKGDKIAGAVLTAIDMGSDVTGFQLQQAIYTRAPEVDSNYRLVMGYQLARKLGVTAGDSLTIVLPETTVTAAGIFPRQRRFFIHALFHSGSSVDANTVFVDLKTGQKIFRMQNGVSSLRINFDDRDAASAMMARISESLAIAYRSSSWEQDFSALFSAVRMEKNMITLMLMVIIVVATFNIISILVMMVSEKREDIAVLRTLGATESDIRRIFMLQGLIIGASGVFFGGLLGWLTATHLESILRILNAQLGSATGGVNIYLPSDWMWSDFFLVCSVSLLLSFLVTIYPSRKASLISPALILNGS